jgi:hypothetical protein
MEVQRCNCACTHNPWPFPCSLQLRKTGVSGQSDRQSSTLPVPPR